MVSSVAEGAAKAHVLVNSPFKGDAISDNGRRREHPHVFSARVIPRLLFLHECSCVLQAVVLTVGKGEEAIAFTERGNIAVFTIFFALIWLASFLLAFRIVFPKVWASFM